MDKLGGKNLWSFWAFLVILANCFFPGIFGLFGPLVILPLALWSYYVSIIEKLLSKLSVRLGYHLYYLPFPIYQKVQMTQKVQNETKNDLIN